jgi:hypothetical protein
MAKSELYNHTDEILNLSKVRLTRDQSERPFIKRGRITTSLGDTWFSVEVPLVNTSLLCSNKERSRVFRLFHFILMTTTFMTKSFNSRSKSTQSKSEKDYCCGLLTFFNRKKFPENDSKATVSKDSEESEEDMLNAAVERLRSSLPQELYKSVDISFDDVQTTVDINCVARQLGSTVAKFMDKKSVPEEQNQTVKHFIQEWFKRALPYVKQGVNIAAVRVYRVI